MTFWFHSAILATSLAATVAVGLASASIYAESVAKVAAKSDRLPIRSSTETTYLIYEAREDDASILTRVPVTRLN